MKSISKALRLCCVILLTLALGACSKEGTNKDERTVCPEPVNLIGQWKIDGHLPIGGTQWRTVATEDVIFYTFNQDGTFEMERPEYDYHLSGTFKLEYAAYPDSVQQTAIKLILTSSDGVMEHKLAWLDDNTFRLDWWWLWCATGYSSARYRRIITSSAQ
jgi:hypothetical protein